MSVADDFDSCKLLIEKIANRGLNLNVDVVDAESPVNNVLVLDSELYIELQHHLNTISCYKSLHTLPEDTLIRVVDILYNDASSVLSANAQNLDFRWVDNEENFVHLSRSVDAAVSLLKMITCNKMPVKIVNEDKIEGISNLLKIVFQDILRPALSTPSTPDSRKRSFKRSRSSRVEYPIVVQYLISKAKSIFGSYTELVRQKLLETSFVISLSQIAVDYFFLCDALDLQTEIIYLLGNIFTVINESSHVDLMRTIVNYICNPLLCKRQWDAYNDTNEVYIEVHLIIQIVQALTSLPNNEDSRTASMSKQLVNHRLKHGQQLLSFLFRFFILGSEDNYRKTIFNSIVNDFLLLLNKPEYPVCTFFVTVLGKHLMQIYIQENVDLSIRLYCLDLIGTIVLSLTKSPPYAKDSSVIIDAILSKINPSSESKKLNQTQILQQSLVDYLILSKENCMTEFALKYYVVAWQYQIRDQIGSESEQIVSKGSKSRQKVGKSPFALQFLQMLSNPKYLRKRVKGQRALLDDDEASVVTRHVTTVGDAFLSCEPFVNYILHAIASDSPVLRTKALKYMCQIVEMNPKILEEEMLCRLVKERLLLDPNSFVREATMDLVGMAVTQDISFVEFFEHQLVCRLKDSSVFVRKRVARIIKNVCESYPECTKIPRLLYSLLGRISDCDSVQSIMMETFFARYFMHQQEDAYYSRATNELIMIAQFCMANNTVEWLEALFKNTVDQFTIATSAFSILSRRLVQCLLPYKSGLASSEEQAEPSRSFVFSTICVLSRIGTALPDILNDHVDDVIWFLEFAIESNVQPMVVKDILSSLDELIPNLETSNNDFYNRIHTACEIVLRTGTKMLIPYVAACLAEIYRKYPSPNNPVLSLFLESLDLLNEIKLMFESKSNDPLPASMEDILRAFYSIGVFSRYFNFDIIYAEADDVLKHAHNMDLSSPKRIQGSSSHRRFRDNIYALLIFFAARGHPDFASNALFSLGQLCITYTEYIKTETIFRLYGAILASTDSRVLLSKIQIINNVKFFLLSEEEKMRRSKIVSNGKDDLKKMDLPENCVSSIVLQSFFKLIARSYIHADEGLRTSSSEIVCLAVQQGFVDPSVCVQELVAMSTDPLEHVREKAVVIIRKVQELLKDCFAGKSGGCLMRTFALQQLAQNCENVRGFRMVEGVDGLEQQSIFWDYYKIFSDSRVLRRVVLSSLFGFFSEQHSTQMAISKLVFLGDCLVTLPFKTADEPLYLVKHIDSIISLSGQSFLMCLKETIFKEQYEKCGDEESFFSITYLSACFSDHIDKMHDVVENGKVCILLLHLKTLLTSAYNLSDKKIREYSVSDPKLHMRSISRRAVKVDDYNELVEFLQTSKFSHVEFVSKIASYVCQFHTLFFSLEG